MVITDITSSELFWFRLLKGKINTGLEIFHHLLLNKPRWRLKAVSLPPPPLADIEDRKLHTRLRQSGREKTGALEVRRRLLLSCALAVFFRYIQMVAA
jgi:hypothetical protein